MILLSHIGECMSENRLGLRNDVVKQVVTNYSKDGRLVALLSHLMHDA